AAGAGGRGGGRGGRRAGGTPRRVRDRWCVDSRGGPWHLSGLPVVPLGCPSVERVGVGGRVPSPTCSRLRGGSGLRSARRACDDLVDVQPRPRIWHRGRTRAPGRCGPVI